MADLVITLGAFVGIVGISIAIVLQLIAPRRCPSVFVVGYFAFGSALVMVHAGLLGEPRPGNTGLAVAGLTALLIMQLLVAVMVYTSPITKPRAPERRQAR